MSGKLIKRIKIRLKKQSWIFYGSLFRYDKREEAQAAIDELNGHIPEGGSEPLSVKIAEEHGKQKAAYYAGWQAGFNQSRGKFVFYVEENACLEY